MEVLKMTKNYLKLNKDVAVALGLKAELQTIRGHLLSVKYCPIWLFKRLHKAITRADYLVDVTVKHRDERR